MSKQIFEVAAIGKKPKRNKFDLSHENKLTGKMGVLIPILVQDVLPTDKFVINSELLVRFAPMLAPMMHRVDATIHYFFVPNRLIWDEWEDFITGGPDGTSAPIPPQIDLVDAYANYPGIVNAPSTLWDYLGLPFITGTNGGGSVSALPFRAYCKIWDDWYRDQNLTSESGFTKTSGIVTDFGDIAVLRKRAWEKDYFTSALPWPQRGNEVLIPIDSDITYKDISKVYLADGTTVASAALQTGSGGLTDSLLLGAGGVNAGRIENIESISNISATINDLRTAEAIQKWLELSARGGARYVEQMHTFFGAPMQDARLQRSEYLGGGKVPIQVSEVLSTFQTPDPATALPQGNMSGHGISFGTSNRVSYYAPEHGWIIGILSVMPRTDYWQGIPRKFFRQTKYDYFWPQLARLGEQEVRNQELYYGNVSQAENLATFGYQSRYSEYKFENNQIHGYFRSSLAYWHMARTFDALPVLNASFVEADPTTRVFAVTDDDIDNLYVHIMHRIAAYRPIPYYSIPSIV